MEQPTEGLKNQLYCWLDRERMCGADCVAFDRNGAIDMEEGGPLTSCRLCNHIDGICRAAITSARTKKKERGPMPGADVPPPKTTIGGR